jgi:hypothetical protein
VPFFAPTNQREGPRRVAGGSYRKWKLTPRVPPHWSSSCRRAKPPALALCPAGFFLFLFFLFFASLRSRVQTAPSDLGLCGSAVRRRLAVEEDCVLLWGPRTYSGGFHSACATRMKSLLGWAALPALPPKSTGPDPGMRGSCEAVRANRTRKASKQRRQTIHEGITRWQSDAYYRMVVQVVQVVWLLLSGWVKNSQTRHDGTDSRSLVWAVP